MMKELAIQAFDFPEGSEVITTPFTFISTTHAIVRNHLTPVFCDVKLSDGTIDESKIEELITDKTVVPLLCSCTCCTLLYNLCKYLQLKNLLFVASFVVAVFL